MKSIVVLLLMVSSPAAAAYYAELDKNDVVLRVVVIEDAAETVNGVTREANGIAFCQRLFDGGIWMKTDTDGSRKHYAGVGYTYNPNIDAFVPPQPFPSWVLEPVKATWVAPVAMPKDGPYSWDEAKRVWVAVSPP